MFIRAIGVAIALISLLGPSAATASNDVIGDRRIEPSDTRAGLAVDPAPSAQSALQPTSKWQIDSKGTMCVLHREYGTPKERFTLEIKAIPTTNTLILYVFDNEPGANRMFSSATVGFGPGIEAAPTRLESYRARRAGYRANSLSLDREQVDRAMTNNFISIAAGSYLNASLSVPDMDAALKALDGCVETQIERWGMSRDAQRAVKAWAEPERPWNEYLNQGNYTLLALMMESTGVNSARIRVDRNGKGIDCQLLERSGAQGLDKVLCPAAMRATFKPTIDRAGNPVDGFTVIRVHWLLL